MIGSYEKAAHESGIDCALICHSGNGVLYSYALAGNGVQSRKKSLLNLVKEFSAAAAQNEGHLIVESSPPALKKGMDVWGGQRGDYEMMRRLKREIDPKGILNPGRFVGGI